MQKSKVVFCCDNLKQLYACMLINNHYYNGVASDLVTTNEIIASYGNKIKSLSAFSNTFTICDKKNNYNDVFISTSQLRSNIINQISKKADIHLYEEESDSYCIDSDVLPNNVNNIFLYSPEFFIGKKLPVIPIIPQKSDRDIIDYFVEEKELPSCKYVFIAENYAKEGHLLHDLPLLEEVSRMVGKENIVVAINKMSDINPFKYSINGFRVFNCDSLFWEYQAFNPYLINKVLISISSHEMYIPFFISHKSPQMVSLFYLMKLSKRNHSQLPNYPAFLSKIQGEHPDINENFYCPRTMFEMKRVFQYIERQVI